MKLFYALSFVGCLSAVSIASDGWGGGSDYRGGGDCPDYVNDDSYRGDTGIDRGGSSDDGIGGIEELGLADQIRPRHSYDGIEH